MTGQASSPGVLDGQVALVTGAAQGLGATFASALAAHGARVALVDLSDTQGACERIVAAGGSAIALQADVTRRQDVQAAMEAAAQAFGGMDILVNNAALSAALRLCKLQDITSEQWDRVMAVNVRGTFECLKAAVPLMAARGRGKIVNIASGTAIKGTPGLLHYVASKGAVISMTRAAARELGPQGIRVNCLAPGLTQSEGVVSHPDWSGESTRSASLASRAIQRDGMPQDLLGAMVFLCSAASDFMTGQTLVVDGGSAMV